MRNDSMSKLSASFSVLVMVLATLVIVPGVSVGETSSTANIYVPVISSGSPVTDAKVNLTDVHTGSVMAAEYSWSRSAYVVSNAPAGYYKVDVSHDDYYDALECWDFRFDGTTNHTVPLIELEGFPYKEWNWNVTVRNSVGQKISGATVGFYDHDLLRMEFVEKAYTNQVGGWAVLDMWDTVDYGGSISLVVIARGYVTYVNPVSVTGNATPTITMTASQKVVSFVTDSSGSPASDVVAYLVNTDDSIPTVKRVLKSTSSYVSFDAYTGSFILVVDAYGCAAHVQPVTVPGVLPPASIELEDQTKRTENVTIDYGADFRSFDLSVNTTWSCDDAYPGLMYNDMGSLRMQVDLARGNGDGVLDDDTEINPFIAEVYEYDSQYVSSASLLTVNDTAYLSGTSTTNFALGLEAGSVINETGVFYAYECAYSADTLDLNATDYTALAYARPDTPAVDYKYQIGLVNGYELVSNSSTTNVKVTGYTTVKIDHVAGTSVEIIAMDFEKSDKASAKGAVEAPEESPDNVFVVKDDNGTVLKYIVKVGANATFTGADSLDPNGNPLLYIWDFDDGSTPVTTANVTYTYVYATAAALRHVTLTVRDVANITNSTVLNVTCDGLGPRPVITVKNETPVDNAITIEQRDAVVFNATDSVDDVVTVNDGIGTIAYVEFDYGDGNKSARIPWEDAEQNVTHAYARAGNFTVVLNVTDVVGHWKNTTLRVFVNDTENPKVSFTVKNATGGSSLIENQTLVFDANATVDNIDNTTLLHFSWDFGDGTWMNLTGADGGSNVTHAYARIGKIEVTLNVTDLSDNWSPMSKFITIAQGQRPNLKIDKIYFEPSNFTEDKSGTILVNMTNRGSAVATNVIVYFYKVNADGTLDLLGQSSEMYNATTGAAVTTVEISGTVQVKFSVSFGSKGTYTLRVNATCANQLKETTSVVSGEDALNVGEATWKAYALWGGVIAVIVLVPLLLFMRARWSKRDKGPRRDKKPKTEEEE